MSSKRWRITGGRLKPLGGRVLYLHHTPMRLRNAVFFSLFFNVTAHYVFSGFVQWRTTGCKWLIGNLNASLPPQSKVKLIVLNTRHKVNSIVLMALDIYTVNWTPLSNPPGMMGHVISWGDATYDPSNTSTSITLLTSPNESDALFNVLQ